ncbi:hypothetical protein [Breznakia pachnodae]|uniref:Uncharacterized protein n=1 Tax=Breznakia pachnodae TaxID=265178 RepID=A0ABU0E3Y6_9FIRM|nr:hypothetical protein [Breznakia pachnodae]MDQ0361618.1 hypothetical protein [Breznakia pachnodae]
MENKHTLEEKIRLHERSLMRMGFPINNGPTIWEELKEELLSKKDFIPKDKIRKLLEEKEKLMKDIYDFSGYGPITQNELNKVQSQIDLLKQLLEEE